jgi:DNA-binding NarL/FixJ family response regulator
MGTPVQAGEPEAAAPAKIARRPGLSVGTARKHQQTIVVRLGVAGRTAAVTRGFPGQAGV